MAEGEGSPAGWSAAWGVPAAVAGGAGGTLWNTVFTTGPRILIWPACLLSVIALVGLYMCFAVLGGWWPARRRAAGVTSSQSAGQNQFADQLAKAVEDQWAQEADRRGLRVPGPIPVKWRRSSLPLAGPAKAAAAARRFDPLPGLSALAETQLMEGQITDLHAIYGGLGSGRLIIAGTAGSGKSGAAVLLALTALAHRKQVADADRPQVPVPLLTTVQEWDPVGQPIRNWLMQRMQETYPLCAEETGARKAAALIGAGQVSLILDGLDEMSEKLRPVALQALSQQAMLRVVLLTRTAEIYAAAKQSVLEGAVAIELQNVDPATAAEYLSRVQVDPPPDGWRQLTDHIREAPRGPLARALDNPLTLTLVRDTYRQGDDARELLKFCDAARTEASGDHLVEQIVDHLLDRVLRAAYKPRPGEGRPPYDLGTAEPAFANIATKMNNDGARSLDLSSLPGWTPAAPRCVVEGLRGGLPPGAIAGVTAWLMAGVRTGVVTGIVVGIIFGIIAGITHWTVQIRFLERDRNQRERRMAGQGVGMGRPRLSWSDYRSFLRFSIPANSTYVFLTTLIAWVVLRTEFGLVGGLLRALVVGLPVGGVYIIAGALGVGLSILRAIQDRASAMSPRGSWWSNVRYGLALALLNGLVFATAFGIAIGFAVGLAQGIAAAIIVASVFAAGMCLTGISLSLTFVQLARRYRTPVRLIRFLDDARERGVLRTVGPLYQFRHARLQDRLSREEPHFGFPSDGGRPTRQG
jgi:hypothetical protein